MTSSPSCCFFFFQAEDGIRGLYVTGVQTCALPISLVDEGADRLRQRLHALRTATRRRERVGALAAQRHLQEPLRDVGDRDLLRLDVDAEPVEEVGAPNALCEPREIHRAQTAGRRSNQRTTTKPSLSSARSTTAPIRA